MSKLVRSLALVPVAAVAMATDSVTIPSTGLDVGAYITAGAAAMATVAATAVGFWFAFKIIKKGLRWAGRALG